MLLAFAAFLLLFGLVGWSYISLFKDNSQTSAQEEPPPDELKVRHDQLYAQAIQSFVAPATNSMLEIITKNNVRQNGTVDFIGHDKVVLDIGGRKHTYNRDWLSQQSREAILAPDYAEAFVRNTFKAEQDRIENDKAKRIREEKERAERESAAQMAEAERRRIENETFQQQEALRRAQIARAEKDKAENEARRYNKELQQRAERQAQIAAQNEQQLKAETQRLMRDVERQRQRLRETLISQGLDPRLADPENRDELLRITRARARQFLGE